MALPCLEKHKLIFWCEDDDILGKPVRFHQLRQSSSWAIWSTSELLNKPSPTRSLELAEDRNTEYSRQFAAVPQSAS